MARSKMNLDMAKEVAARTSEEVKEILKLGKFEDVSDEVVVAYEKLRRQTQPELLIGHQLSTDEVEARAEQLGLKPNELNELISEAIDRWNVSH